MESPQWMFTKALSHRQKVCRLYKRCLRELHAWIYSSTRTGAESLLDLRYQSVIMRARFEANRDVKDSRVASALLADGCRQLWQNRHAKAFRFELDPGGSSYDRDASAPDALADNPQYTFAEREQFPYYYNRREQRKKEVMQHWKKIEEAWDKEISEIQKELPKEKPAINP